MSVYIELLYRSLESRLGIIVRVDGDLERARQKFYAARREAAVPAFESLVIKPSHSQPETELWLVRKEPNA